MNANDEAAALRARVRELTDDLERERRVHAEEAAALRAAIARLTGWLHWIAWRSRGRGHALAHEALYTRREAPFAARETTTNATKGSAT